MPKSDKKSNLKQITMLNRLLLMPITMQFASCLIGKKYGEYVHPHHVLVQGHLEVAEKFSFEYDSDR